MKYEFRDVSDAQYVSAVKSSSRTSAELVATGGRKVSLLRLEEGRPATVWTLYADAAVGSPILGDVNADGRSEMLVVDQSGMLLVIGDKK